MEPEQERNMSIADNIKPRKYVDLFGSGDTKSDALSIVGQFGEPLEIAEEGQSDFMVALLYEDKIVVTGYDGNEYKHTFVLLRNK